MECRKSAAVRARRMFAIAALVSLPTAASAAIEWDPQPAVGGAQGGDGVWTASAVNVNWYNGSGNVPCPSGADVLFGHTAGTVTLSNTAGPLVANSVTFSTAGYRLQGQTLTLADAGTLAVDADATLACPVAGTAFQKTGGGVLSLSAANAFSGVMSISAGTVVATCDGALGTSAGSTRVVAGAAFSLSGGVNYATNELLQLAGGGPDSLGAFRAEQGNNTWGGGVTLNSASAVYVADGASLNVSGVFSGDALTKEGAGLLFLSSTSNSLVAGTTVAVNGGALRINGTGSLGSAQNVTIRAGWLELNDSGSGATLSRPISLENGSGYRGLGAAPVHIGLVKLATAASATFTLSGGNAATDLFTVGSTNASAAILSGGSSSSTLRICGNGIVSLVHDPSSPNSVAGNWRLESGTLRITSEEVLGNVNNDITLAGGTLDVSLSSSTLSLASSRTLTVSQPGGTILVSPATRMLTGSAGLLGTGELTKAGPGILRLGIANPSFTGPVHIAAGTLALGHTASLTNSPRITLDQGAVMTVPSNYSLAAGQLLTGDGTVSGPFTVASGTLAPGGGSGTLSFSSILGVSSSSRLLFDLDQPGTPGERINASGGLNIAGGLVAITDLGHFQTGLYTLMQYTGTLGGAAANLQAAPSSPGGYCYEFLNDPVNRLIQLQVTSLGPNEWALAGGGSWNDPQNWTAKRVPQGEGGSALIGGKLSSAGTITLDSPLTVGTLSLATPVSCSLTGQQLTLKGGNHLTVVQGHLAVAAPVCFDGSTDISVAAGAHLTLSGPVSATPGTALHLSTDGTLSLSTDLGPTAAIYFDKGTALLQASQTLRAPAFAAGARVSLTASDLRLNIQDSTAPGAISPATISSIWSLVRAGYNGGSGPWTGTGITTTAVTNSSLNGLGLVLSGDPALEAQTLTVREMILGDVNGDNKVTIGDVMVALNSANYQQDGTWLNGDVNYDGKVTIGDVMLMLNSTRYQQDYNPANAPAQIAALEAAGLGSLAAAAVPEPATLGLLAIGAMGFLARRRR